MSHNNIKFKIDDNGYLLVSYDKGCTWENIGKVQGDPSTVVGPQGPAGVQGIAGNDGRDGADGSTPTINESTLTWWVNGVDTGVVARGEGMEIVIEASPDIADTGTPYVSSRVEDGTLYLQFHQLKGDEGNGPELTVEEVDNTVIFKIDGVIVATLQSSSTTYDAGTHIEIDDGTINCLLDTGEGLYKDGNIIALDNRGETLDSSELVTVSYESTKYITINTANDSTITINVDLHTATPENAFVREVVCRIVNTSEGESGPAVIYINKNGEGTVVNMFDVTLTNGSGYSLYSTETIELVFTFWSENDVTFNGGTNVAII